MKNYLYDTNNLKYDPNEVGMSMQTTLRLQNRIYLAERPNTPDLFVTEDDDACFFNPEENAIWLGTLAPLTIFDVKDQEEYIASFQYLFGHENQHVLSTATIPYRNGIYACAHVLIEELAAREGIHKNFRTERDYEACVLRSFPEKGLLIPYEYILSFASKLMNSLEDGRIERIRSLNFPGFEKQRKYFRGLFWKNAETEFPKDLSDPEDHLIVLLQCILSLSTVNLYPRGFALQYEGKPIMDEVQDLMPDIAHAVMAGCTRDMAKAAVAVCKKIAPLFCDICQKRRIEDFAAALRKILSALVPAMPENNPDEMANTSEKEEQTDDGTPNSVFEHSDLVLVVDDKTYDSLTEQTKQQKGSNAQTSSMIQREHSKESKEEDESDSLIGADQSTEQTREEGKQTGNQIGEGGVRKDHASDNSKKSTSSTSTNSAGEKSSEKNGCGPESKEESEDPKSSSDESVNGSNGISGKDSTVLTNTESTNTSGKEAETPTNKGADDRPDHQQQSSSSDSSETECDNRHPQKEMTRAEKEEKTRKATKKREPMLPGAGADDEILEAMKKAALDCRKDAEKTSSIVNQAREHSAGGAHNAIPVVENTDTVITPQMVKEICSDFKEWKREYKVDLALPPILSARARAFRKKNERYFRSLNSPTITNLSSGNVDPSLIFGLALNETDVFRKIGQNNQFDGCVYILLDNSGSMRGEKRVEAGKAAAVIEEGFKGLIPMKIVAFDSVYGQIQHEIVKGWTESQRKNCCWNFVQHGRTGNGNEDNYDILIAQKELLLRPERKKLLIILSDGTPSDTKATQQAIVETRKKGIQVFGIYFEQGRVGSEAARFKQMYQKDFVCCSLDEVDENLTKLMIKFSRS